ncbi:MULTISPECIES: cytochrome C oxidase subunit IV family protein [Ralstonia]|uniref:cytochrome C oxidase subunit IV family protein n=1 Tax=Ralstonia TaxID=48736 RepID=UPI002AAC6208|nr:cytochrome C oxidase subunit IV family protein [Ralstonia wenshanensis]MDY7510023.1 Caa(3)-type oxidase subunit IV [Ralstonia wenshanensis]
MKTTYGAIVGVWVLLMALLAATAASTFLPLGIWNSVINMLIATAKALLIAKVYMQLRGVLLSVTAAAPLFLLAVLIALSTSDYGTRLP